MPHAMRVYEYGGTEKLRWEQVEVGAPGEGQVRVRNTAVGLNFVDTYQRSGLYPTQLPFTPGARRWISFPTMSPSSRAPRASWA